MVPTGSKRNAVPSRTAVGGAELIASATLKAALAFSERRLCRTGDDAPRQHAVECRVEKTAHRAA